MRNNVPIVKLGELLTHRGEFIIVDDLQSYKRVTAQLHAKGIILRDEIEGALIKTKKQRICKAGDFLVAEIDAKLGGFGIVPPDLEGSIVSSHYFLFEINTTKLVREYLDFFIRTEDFQKQITARGSTNYAAIRPPDVLQLEIPLPPLKEQQQLVILLDKLETRIDTSLKERKSAIKQTDAFLISSLLKAFHPSQKQRISFFESADQLLLKQAAKYKSSPKLNFDNAHPDNPNIFETGLYDLPKGWVWSDLGSILIRLVDCVNDTPDFSLNSTEYIGLKSTNIKPYTIDLSEKWYLMEDDFNWWNRREKPLAGDLILTREAPMGNVCILPDKFKFCLTQRLMLLRNDPNFIDSRYLLHYLNSPYFKNQIEEQCRGLTTPHLRVGDAPNIKIPIAPLEIQHHIVSHLDGLQVKINEVKRLQGETERELMALIPAMSAKAFSGGVNFEPRN